jgi:Serpentine type 7TM GPCR chemoreceptor Srw
VATTWTTVLLTVHRYVVVCRPFDAKRLATVSLARRQLAVVLAASVVFNVPRFLEHRIVRVDWQSDDDVNATSVSPMPTRQRMPVAVKRQMARSEIYENVYLVGAYNIVIYGLPVALLAVFTYRLIRALNAAKVGVAVLCIKVYTERASY